MTQNTKERLFKYCTELQISEDTYEDILRIMQDEVDSQDKANYEMLRVKRDLEKKAENMKKVIEEQGIRFRNKLMSVYYLLGTIKKMGTHHEKEVAVRYLQTTVEDLIRHDGLGWDQDLFELPF